MFRKVQFFLLRPTPTEILATLLILKPFFIFHSNKFLTLKLSLHFITKTFVLWGVFSKMLEIKQGFYNISRVTARLKNSLMQSCQKDLYIWETICSWLKCCISVLRCPKGFKNKDIPGGTREKDYHPTLDICFKIPSSIDFELLKKILNFRYFLVGFSLNHL